MKIMKRNIIITALGILGLSSCNSWIEEDPSSLVTDERVGDSEAAAKQWVTGTYSKWIYDMFCWGYFPKVLEMDADYISGPDWLFKFFGAGSFQGESDVTDALWKGCYGLIARANNAERHIAAMSNLSQRAKNNAIGEMKFQRAMAYFLLVRAYGELPIQPEEETSQQSQPRQPIQAVYNYITSNLEQATSLLYKNTDKAYEAGHVSAGSAAGLLAKVYATMASAAMPVGTEVTVRTGHAYDGSGNDKTYAPLQSHTFQKTAVAGYEGMDAQALYAKAADWARRLVETEEFGNYELLAYDNLWKKAHAADSEFLFSIGSVSGDATYKTSVHTQYEGYMISTGSEFIQEGCWVGCTRHWYDLFDHDDYRITKGVKHRWRVHTQAESNTGFYYPYDREYTILATGKDLVTGSYDYTPSGIYGDGVSYYYSMDAQCLAFTTKYTDVTDDAIADADANWPMLRLADVYLIYAEALNETGNAQEAVNYLNKVRNRSNANDASLTGNGALDTQAKRRSAIIEERAKELACEADRRWDLIRWGIYLDAMNAVVSDDAGISKTRMERNLLFPIPTAEINTNKYINSNNPGWN